MEDDYEENRKSIKYSVDKGQSTNNHFQLPPNT